ncbi:GTPase Era [Eubacteriales bacterium OttesenSCG-928-G02]|nr:GTPase Era [Eubacteriales bacterium OttesenSCG-928-G02]
MTRSVFVLLTGRPNVGKSTLTNSLIGEKVAIVSKKPQTTRNKIVGVLTENEDQYVLIDTPGLHSPKNLLGNYMMKAIGNASADADVILFIVDASLSLNKIEHETLEAYSKSNRNVILIINKIDCLNKLKLLDYMDAIHQKYNFQTIIPISALTGDGVDIVKKELAKYLVESPHFFPDDITSDQPERQLVAEVIREKILRLTDDEIPHGVAVVIEDYKESKSIIKIRAEIYCEKESHKSILIGNKGDMLKKIGSYAREDLEEMLGIKIFLDLWVKTKENWRDRQGFLNSFGYKDE